MKLFLLLTLISSVSFADCYDNYAKAKNTTVEEILETRSSMYKMTDEELGLFLLNHADKALIAIGSIGCDYQEIK